jgi:PIN domain nuclease of toxin-antitoxin system
VKSAGSAKPVFDAAAVLALIQGEPGAEKLQGLQANALVNAVNVAEVLAKLVNRGMPPLAAQAAFEALHLEVSAFEPPLAAASASYVHQGISLGDRCFLATARQHGSGWTSDRDLGTVFGDRVRLSFFR